MSNPFPGITVDFDTKPYEISITNPEKQIIERYSDIRDVTNYEYEVTKNEEKRKILILKPEYLNAVLQDMRNIMTYDTSSQTIDNKTKRAYNPKLTGI